MNPEDIARLLTEDPDIFNENWDELGIRDPGFKRDEFDDNLPGMSWLLVFSPKNFGSREEAIEYAKHCFNVDLSDGRQHNIKINGCEVLVELQFNKDI